MTSRMDPIGQNGNDGEHYVLYIKTDNFSRGGDQYFSCPCCGKGGLAIELLIVLEHVRAHFNKPVTITSGARCVEHNKKVGGATNSIHIVSDKNLVSKAADIQVKDTHEDLVVEYLENLPYANLLGIGRYKGRTHVDVRGYSARW